MKNVFQKIRRRDSWQMSLIYQRTANLGLIILFSAGGSFAMAFTPLQLEVCPQLTVATGDLIGPVAEALRKDEEYQSNPGQLNTLLGPGAEKLSDLNSRVLNNAEREGNLGESEQFSTVGSALGYLTAVVQNLSQVNSSAVLALNVLPRGLCQQIENNFKAANNGYSPSKLMIPLRSAISESNVPHLPTWIRSEKNDQRQLLKKIISYLQIAGMNLHIVNDVRDSKIESRVDGSIVFLFPRNFSMPLKDVETLNGNIRIDKFFFDEYPKSKNNFQHYLVINFRNLLIHTTRSIGNPSEMQVEVAPTMEADIDFTGGADLEIDPLSRSTKILRSFPEVAGLAKPNYNGRLKLVPADLERYGKSRPYLKKLVDSLLTFNLIVKHFKAKVKTVLNKDTGHNEYYPVLLTDQSVDFGVPAPFGERIGQRFLGGINVDSQVQGSIDGANHQLYGYMHRFYTEVRDSFLQFRSEYNRCFQGELELDKCSEDLRSRFKLPVESE